MSMQTLSCRTQGVEGALHEIEAIMGTDLSHLERFQSGCGVYIVVHCGAVWLNGKTHLSILMVPVIT